MRKTQLLRDVRSYARSPYAWPGGYPLILIMDDGECLCAKCARVEYRAISFATRNDDRTGWQASGVDVYWEGEPIYCAHCNATIESAYGPVDEAAE